MNGMVRSDLPMPTHQPSLARDTRLLMTIILVSILMLWGLARIRFPDLPATPNPVPPMLAPLVMPSPFDDIVEAIAQVTSRLTPIVEPVRAGASRTLTALRFGGDRALLLLPFPLHADRVRFSAGDAQVLAHDAATDLAVVRSDGAMASPSTWVPRRMAGPQFLIASTVSDDAVSFHPVFVGSLWERASPTWSGSIWMLPPSTVLERGSFVFNVDGEWAGLAVDEAGAPAIVPAARLVAIANGLADARPRPRGVLGIDVQPLEGGLAAATGTKAGVIVTFVDPHGPGAERVDPTDVIVAIDGAPVSSLDDWTARTARLAADEAVRLSVKRPGWSGEVRVTAQAVSRQASPRPLGLTLRTLPRAGAQIVRIDPDSAAAAAGLLTGDVLTVVGNTALPTAPEALGALADASADRPVVVAFTRGTDHRVVALVRTW